MQVSDEIFISDYDPAWPRRFETEAARIRQVIGDIQIEHFGSTAVPGMPAKPVIDMMVAIDSIYQGERFALALEGNGYEAVEPRYRKAFPERIIMIRRGADGSRRAHVHLLLRHHRMWDKHLAFRDHLRSHPEAALRYADLKRNLAEECRFDRQRYMTGKAGFIESIG